MSIRMARTSVYFDMYLYQFKIGEQTVIPVRTEPVEVSERLLK